MLQQLRHFLVANARPLLLTSAAEIESCPFNYDLNLKLDIWTKTYTSECKFNTLHILKSCNIISMHSRIVKQSVYNKYN